MAPLTLDVQGNIMGVIPTIWLVEVLVLIAEVSKLQGLSTILK